ncbi:MAG: STAS domain-containing protein [Sedimentisphaerales bacterium]|nr:STAS domain-containing protein [Sedimentisphaerales bacterium]
MEMKSEHVIILGSLDRTDRNEQIDKLLAMTQENADWDIIVDLSDITINSRIISKLLELRETAKSAGREVILCGIDTQVKSVFTVTGIDGVFRLEKDRTSALTTLEELRQGLHATT